MNTYDTEMLDSDAPVDVYAENALRGQHLALIEDDQAHVTSPMQGNSVRNYIRSLAGKRWRDALYAGFEAVIAVIPIELNPQVGTITIRLAGTMASQASTPLALNFGLYLGLDPDERDDTQVAYVTSVVGVTLTINNPRPQDTYQDLLIVTMASALPIDPGAAAWQVTINGFALEDGTYGGTATPNSATNGADNMIYFEDEQEWFEVGNYDSPDDRGRLYGGRLIYSQGAGMVAITGWRARSIAMTITGVDGSGIVMAQPELYANIPVQGQVHARHDFIINRARDHRRYLSIRPSGDLLVGVENTVRSPWRRADFGARVLVRDSIYLDRGARGVLSARIAALYYTGDNVSNDNADASTPDRESEQTFTVRLSQHEDGSATPAVIGEAEVTLTLNGWTGRSPMTQHRALNDVSRWRFQGTHARLEDFPSRDSGAGYRWGTMAPFELALLNLCRFDLPLEGLTFDASLPLILEVFVPVEAVPPAYNPSLGNNPTLTGSNWRLPYRSSVIAVGGSICWEGP